MAHKQVPDWLNSSLWSTPQPPPSSPRSNVVKPSADEAIVEPPAPMPPPAPRTYVDVGKGEIRDPLSSNYGTYSSGNHYSDDENGSSSANSTMSAGGGHLVSVAAAPSATEDISRQAQILQELSRKFINMGELRRLASQGIPDGGGIRAMVWKLLLGYLPTDRSLWPSELAKKRSQYKHFKEELLVNPAEAYLDLFLIGKPGQFHKVQYFNILDCQQYSLNVSMASQSEIMWKQEESSENNEEADGFLSRSGISREEHPLSLGKSSIWNQFFQDTEIIDQIDRDVKRTHPDMHFFSADSAFAKANQEALKDILSLYAKLNPGIRYVQGMNELLAPLFYVFANDPTEENMASAEADTFFCFVELLGGLRDNFVQQLDNSVVGIRSTIARLSRLLKEHDEELWRHLDTTTKVNPQFYAFRWITLLLTQEFNFSDSLLIWDTLLSDPDGPQETLLRVCCAMLILVRKRLLAGDFTSNLKLLQHFPSTNISHLLYVANKLRFHSAG